MTAADQLRGCRAQVERASAMLLEPAPDALEGCSAVLRSAAERLTALRPAVEGATGDAEALVEAWQLRRSVRRAGALLANASAWHTNWNELLRVRTVGYRPGGEPGDAHRAGRLSVTG